MWPLPGSQAPHIDPAYLEFPLPAQLPEPRLRYGQFIPLGAGGKADVSLCQDRLLGRQVAYKVLRRELASDAEEQQALVREARIMAALAHPCVPEVFDLGRDADNRPFFTMQPIAGTPLDRILDRMTQGDKALQRVFPLERRVLLTLRAAEVMAAAHARGVCHGDVKPANLIVPANDAVVLLDWGLSTVSRDGFRTPMPGRRQGTPMYMPPELLGAKPQRRTARSDVYSLGAVFYECLTLAPPAIGSDRVEVFEQIVAGAVIPPRRRAPNTGITPNLEDVCLRALARDPGQRFANAVQFAEALRDCHLELLIEFERELDALRRLELDVTPSGDRGEPADAPATRESRHGIPRVTPLWHESLPETSDIPTASDLDAWWDLRATDSTGD